MSGDKEKDKGDYLGYGVYADTLWNRVEAALNKDQGDPDKLGDDPLVVGIFGEWGAGKSKLLSLILERAQRQRNERIAAHKRDDGFSLTVPVFFQPWKYEHEKHLLVPLLLHIEAELTRCLTLAETTSDKAKGKAVSVAQAVKAHVPAVVEGFKTLWGAARTAYQLAEPASAGVLMPLAEWLAGQLAKDGSDKKEVTTPMTKFRWDAEGGRSYYELHEVLKAVTRPTPEGIKKHLPNAKVDSSFHINFVIFIDDLDRCLPEKAVETLELIKTVFNLESFAFVLALDEEVVERGIGHRYKDYALKNKKPEMPITGFEYLEKIVHLPFRLPGLTSKQAGVLVRRYEESIQATEEHRWFSAPLTIAGQDLEDVKQLGRSQTTTALRQMGRDIAMDLMPMLTSAFDLYVPRKLIRVVELMNQIGEVNRQPGRRAIARRYGESDALDPRVVLALVMLQLFSPDLYRFMRRRPSAFSTLLGAFVSDKNKEEKDQEAQNGLGFYVSDAALLDWVVPGADLRIGSELFDELGRQAAKHWTDPRDKLAAQGIRLPLVRLLLEHRALQRNPFDPIRLFQTLAAEMAHTGQNPRAVTLRPYLRLLVETPARGGQKAEKRQRHRVHQVDELLNDMLFDDFAVRSNLLDLHDVPDDAFLSAGTVERLAHAMEERLNRVRDKVGASDEHESRSNWDRVRANAIDAISHVDEAIAPEDRETLRISLITAADEFHLPAVKLLTLPETVAQYARLQSAWGWDERFEETSPGLLKAEHRRSDASEHDEPIPGFVRIAALKEPFSIGSELDGGEGDQGDNPKGQVSLAHDFFMARYLTTVAQYRHFVDAKGYEDPQWWDSQGWAWRNMQWAFETNEPALRQWLDNRDEAQRMHPMHWEEQLAVPSAPVWGVNWFEARAYARWLTAQLKDVLTKLSQEKTPYEVRLPTEWQWERAARAGAQGEPTDQHAPWQNDEDAPRWANIGDGDIDGVSVVGLFPPSALGLCDMHGNVWEWQDNLYSSAALHKGCRRIGRLQSASEGTKPGTDWLKTSEKWGDSDRPALRGGAWGSAAEDARASFRYGDPPGGWYFSVGFRVVLSLAE